jgi:hypothetical protein
MKNYATQFNANPCKAQKDIQTKLNGIYLTSSSGNTLPKMRGNLENYI